LVNETRLFEISKKLDLQKYIKLGIGESNSKLVSPSIIADCFEAIVGAIYLDGGNVPAHEFIYMAFEDVLEKSDYLLVDSKTRLQEEIQKRFKTAPIYQLIGTCGSGHYKTFEVEIVINGHSISTGLGSSKKVAEMNAAKNCLLQLLGPATNKISY
jgi:ribonuclease-3